MMKIDDDNSNKFSMKNLVETINKREKLDEGAMEMVNVISELESQLEKLKREAKGMKRRELSRIGKEFISSDYERRFKIDLQSLISALVGEDNSHSEMNSLMKEKKVLMSFITHRCTSRI